MPKKNKDEMFDEKSQSESIAGEALTAGFAIEGNLVVLNITKISPGLDLSPQGRSKSSVWMGFEPNGLLPITLEMLDCDFYLLEDGSRALSEQGAKDLIGRLASIGVAGIRTSYDRMLQREDDTIERKNF